MEARNKVAITAPTLKLVGGDLKKDKHKIYVKFWLKIKFKTTISLKNSALFFISCIERDSFVKLKGLGVLLIRPADNLQH